jgi:Fur family transcriptional regulator, ferric uptake regulator
MIKSLIINKKERNSHQRKMILDILKKDKSHPTAKQLFKMVQKQMPDIGFATIYRNLDYLEKNNKIIKLRSKDKEARYDGLTSKHCHLICKKCSGILDLTDVEEITIKSDQLKRSKFILDPTYAEIFGVCRNCKK